MPSTVIKNVTGTVAFVNEKGAYIDTQLGRVFAYPGLVSKNKRVVWRAEVKVDVSKAERTGKGRAEFEAEFLKVTKDAPSPPEPKEYYGRVVEFNRRKRSGWVCLIGHPAGENMPVFLDGKALGIKAKDNDAVRVTITESQDGLAIAAVDFGDNINAIVEKLEQMAKQKAVDTRSIVAKPDGSLLTSNAPTILARAEEDKLDL